MLPSARRLALRTTSGFFSRTTKIHAEYSVIPLVSSVNTGLEIAARQTCRAYGYSFPRAFSSLSITLDARVGSVKRAARDEPHSIVLPDGRIQIRAPKFEGLDKVTGRLQRDFVQRTPLPPSKDYVTLSFYQFRPIAEEDLLKLQYYFLTDLRAMDVVGRIYVSTEGINAQISCPKNRVDDFKGYYSRHWPIFDKIRFNPAMSEGRAFKKLHVRMKDQVNNEPQLWACMFSHFGSW